MRDAADAGIVRDALSYIRYRELRNKTSHTYDADRAEETEKVENHSWTTAPSRARRVLRPGDTVIGTVRPGNGSFALIMRSAVE